MGLPTLALRPKRTGPPGSAEQPLVHHTVAVCHGALGRRLGAALTQKRLPLHVIEADPAPAAPEGANAPDGDPWAGELEAAGVRHAKLVVVAVDDADVTSHVVACARALNPTLWIVASVRYLDEVPPLSRAGADVVVAEELEASVRLLTQVLGAYLLPVEEVDRHALSLREEAAASGRASAHRIPPPVVGGLDPDGLRTRTVAVRKGTPVDGNTLGALGLRRDYGLTLLAVRHNGRLRSNLLGHVVLKAGDHLVLMGSAEQFASCAHLFRTNTSGVASPAS